MIPRRPAPAMSCMKAVCQEKYGVVGLEDVAEPVPSAGEVRVRVRAASVNARDWHVMRGDPCLGRLMLPAVMGPGGPRRRIRGTDFAGTVESVGAGVDRFRPGDEVYGDPISLVQGGGTTWCSIWSETGR